MSDDERKLAAVAAMWLLGCSVALGCGGEQPSSQLPMAAAPSANSGSVAPSSEPSVAPAASAAAAAKPAPLAEESIRARVAQKLVSDAGWFVKLAHLTGATWLLDPQIGQPTRTVYAFEQDAFVAQAKLSKGIPADRPMFDRGIHSAGGHWPKQAWMSHLGGSVATGDFNFYRWSGSRWVVDSSLYGNTITVAAILPWLDERVLLVTSGTTWPRTDIKVLGGSSKGAPVLTSLEFGSNKYTLHAQSAAATASGHVFVAGKAIANENNDVNAAVEHFAPRSSRGTLHRLDPKGKASEALALLSLSDTETYVLVRPIPEPHARTPVEGDVRLMRFDGQRWAEQDMPAEVKPDSLAAADATELWAWNKDSGKLWRRKADRSWVRVNVQLGGDAGKANALAVREVWPRAKDGVWLVGDGAEGGVVARVVR